MQSQVPANNVKLERTIDGKLSTLLVNFNEKNPKAGQLLADELLGQTLKVPTSDGKRVPFTITFIARSKQNALFPSSLLLGNDEILIASPEHGFLIEYNDVSDSYFLSGKYIIIKNIYHK